MDEVIVVIDGRRFFGWKEVPDITRTMEAIVNRFEVRAADIAADSRLLSIEPGAPLELLIGNDRVLRGYIQEVLPDYGRDHHDRIFVGDSRTVDLVDCSTEGRQFRDQTLLDVARALLEPFGIAVRANVDLGAPFASLDIDAGQPIYEFLEYAARMRGVRFIASDDGNLVIDRIGSRTSSTALELGVNILQARPRYSYRERYSQYTVVSDDSQSFAPAAKDTALKKGVARDRHIRYRPITILSDFPADIERAQAQALWQSKLNQARSRSVRYTVKGWRDNDGQLWTPNTLVPVRDRFAGLNEQMLIVETQFSETKRGRLSDLVVMHPDALKQQAIPEPQQQEGIF